MRAIEKIFADNNGYLHSSQIRHSRSMQYQLRELVENGTVEQLRRGLYKMPETATLNYWQEIALLYPKGVLCLESACAYYHLSTNSPNQIHLAVGHKDKIQLAPYPPVQLYYWSDKYYKQHVVREDGISIYTVERTICDIIRTKYQTDLAMVKEVATDYLERKDKNIDLLMQTATEIGAEKKVKQVFELLV